MTRQDVFEYCRNQYKTEPDYPLGGGVMLLCGIRTITNGMGWLWNWNWELTSWEAPAVFGNENFWGQQVVRFYDPDGHLIEVGTPM